MFYVDFKPLFGNEYGDELIGTGESMGLRVGLASWFDLQGEFSETVCFLAPAIMRYNVIIKDNTIGFSSQGSQGSFVAFAKNTKRASDDPSDVKRHQLATTGLLTDMLGLIVYSNASVILDEDSPPDSIYRPDTWSCNANVLRHMNWSNTANDLNFVDPTTSILSEYNSLMLRAAAKTSAWPEIVSLVDPGVVTNQTVVARQTMPMNVFHSDLRWYAGAVIVELVTILLILPLFYGWWEFGVHPTLSPFAIALAFDSPTLKDVNSAVDAKGVVRESGSMRLRYGEAIQESRLDIIGERSRMTTTGRLGIAESHKVIRPQRGMQFSS